MNDMTLLRRKSKKDDEVIDSLWENYIKARIEIDELHEKYRWRKQSEELPKNDDIVQIWGRKYFELSFGYYNYKEKTWYERRHEDDDVECGEYIRYWRPLDLPEEEAKRDD